MNNLLIYLLLSLNSLLLIILCFWQVNQDCQECKETLPPSRVFTFKSKCAYCERNQNE